VSKIELTPEIPRSINRRPGLVENAGGRFFGGSAANGNKLGFIAQIIT
jgi:hypothetical protein